MRLNANSVDHYLELVDDQRREPFKILRETIRQNIPKGFSEELSYGMIGYVVPFSIYPAGYRVTPKVPLPLINIGVQKNFIALYHLGIYADPDLLDWFTAEYPIRAGRKPDMGKGCIRFANGKPIPYDIIGELAQKVSVTEWIGRYESSFVNKPHK